MTIYKFIVGVVLAFAMIAVLAMSALVFSARDFQYGVGGLISFEALSEANASIDQIEADTSGPRGDQQEFANQVANFDDQIRLATQDADGVRAAMVGVIAEIERGAGITAASAATDISAQALSGRLNELARSSLAPADQQRLAQLRSQLQQLVEKEEQIDALDVQRAAAARQQREADALVTEANARILALQAQVVPNVNEYERIRSEARALEQFSPWGVSSSLAQGPPNLLSTILVLLMGALGSLLYLFPAYLNRAAPVTVAEIIVRLIFGMCAALAFYVLANAAVASFAITTSAQAAQPTTSAALNPFTISLIGIVAGVMSEDIAKWIQERGKGILSQGGGYTPATPPPAAAASNEGAGGGGLVNNQAIS